MARADSYASHTDRFLGVETDQAEGYGAVVVRDGLGGQIPIDAGERQGFSVQLDGDGCFFWRCSEEERAEGFPVIERTKVSWKETNYIQVTRDSGRKITWACYERRAAGEAEGASSPPPAAGPTLSWNASAAMEAAAPLQAADYMQPGGSAREARPDGRGSPLLSADGGDWKKMAVSMTKDLLEYVEEAPRRLSMMCMVGGIAIAVNGAFDVLDIFEVFDATIYYVVHCYMVFFGVVTCITEMHPEWSPQVHQALSPVQRWMHEWAKGLTTLWGRGLFHMFQGTLAILSSGPLRLGIIIGAYMLVMGVLYLYLHFSGPGAAVTQADYIRIGG